LRRSAKLLRCKDKPYLGFAIFTLKS
jgi:hypothetical protein